MFTMKYRDSLKKEKELGEKKNLSLILKEFKSFPGISKNYPGIFLMENAFGTELGAIESVGMCHTVIHALHNPTMYHTNPMNCNPLMPMMSPFPLPTCKSMVG